MPLTLPSAQDRLAEARVALHALMTGQHVVSVRDADGSSLEYGRASIGALRAYIAELQAEVAGLSPAAGPMRPVF